MDRQQDDQSKTQFERDEGESAQSLDEEPAIYVAGYEDDSDASLAEEGFDTGRETGRTYEPQKAVEEGLSYTPPRDPPTVPSDEDPQGSEMAAGFAASMEDTDPDERILPERIEKGDLEIQEDVGLALRYNSETAHLNDLVALVSQGAVRLYGTVPAEDDIARVYDIVSDLVGVDRVISHLEVAA